MTTTQILTGRSVFVGPSSWISSRLRWRDSERQLPRIDDNAGATMLLPMGHLRTSIYEISPRSLAVAFAGLGVVLIPAVFARRLIRKTGSGPTASVNRFDRLAIGWDSQLAERLSNAGMILGIATPFAIDWLDTRGEPDAFLEDAWVIGQALALIGAVTTTVKYIVQRPLPETYAGVVQNRRGKPRGYRAFYSGHVSAMATSLAAECVTMRRRHGRLKWRWPWLLSATLTGLVGLGRIFSGKHFPSDVLVGAPVGAATGAVVPLLHARRGGLRRAWAKLRGVRRWRAAVRRIL
jgi:membrane-associated phospholipid phosphatase